ncbi:MAG: GspH/FimT family pseudopilin [Oceanicaulis sp.]
MRARSALHREVFSPLPSRGRCAARSAGRRGGGALHREAGVSLLEMLAALSIVAVMATAVVVLGDFGDSTEEAAGERLLRSFAEARREALLSGAFVGFSADPDGRGYRFFRRGEAVWLERRDHPALEPVRFSDPDLLLALTDGGVARREAGGLAGEETRPLAPEVWFDPAGFDDPFAYRLEGPDGAAIVSRGDDGGLVFEHQARRGGG